MKRIYQSMFLNQPPMGAPQNKPSSITAPQKKPSTIIGCVEAKLLSGETDPLCGVYKRTLTVVEGTR